MRQAVILILLCALALPAHAATVDDATVNLYCRMKLSGRTYSSTGTGVLVSDRGIILTNAHVAQRFLLATSTSKTQTKCTVRTDSPAKDTYTAEVLYLPTGWVSAHTKAIDNKQESTGTGEYDFALLAITGSTKKKTALPASFPSVALASTTPSDGTSVSITGYPAEKLDYNGVLKKLIRHTASSTVTGTRTFERPHADILLVGPSSAGQSGVSGGPVTASSTVVGIVSTMGGEKKGGLRSIRAVSAPYIQRITMRETSLAFTTLLTGDIPTRIRTTQASFPASFIAELEKTLRRIN